MPALLSIAASTDTTLPHRQSAVDRSSDCGWLLKSQINLKTQHDHLERKTRLRINVYQQLVLVLQRGSVMELCGANLGENLLHQERPLLSVISTRIDKQPDSDCWPAILRLLASNRGYLTTL